MDCMEYMKTVPDKFFDIAIVDPPYGINAPKMVMGGAFLVVRITLRIMHLRKD